MRKLLFLGILLYLFFSKTTLTKAKTDDLIVDVNTEYKFEVSGKANVTHTISIKNLKAESYSKSYLLSLDTIDPKNIKAYEGGQALSVFREQHDNFTNLKIDFKDVVAGKDKTRTFIVSYKTDSLARKLGEVWKVKIPKLVNPDSFGKYKIAALIPKEFGEESFISPLPREIKNEAERTIYIFEKEDIKNEGATIEFGTSQVFSFVLKYHLENQSEKADNFQIAIPPDTSFQKVFYQEFNPPAENITVDGDGNWLAIFRLYPKQKLEVKVEGFVQILAKAQKLPIPSFDLSSYTKPTQYWQADDPEIVKIASVLEGPEDIYRYVIGTLTYDYQRIKPEVSRFGAKETLQNPKNALCLEFTDLFIALARAKGIPAREVNGFAYSDDPKLKPLSLVADVLHAWPEYWNEKDKVWTPVDPTWGSTSSLDFFNNFDLRHITFVIHGKNPTQPLPPGSYKLGANPQKDVYIAVAKLPNTRLPEIEIKVESLGIPFFNKTLKITFKNIGASAVYEISPTISSDSRPLKSFFINLLAPGSKFETQIKIPLGIMGIKTPDSLKVSAYRTQIEIPLSKKETIIYQLLILFLALTLILVPIYIITREDLIKKIISKAL